MLTSIFNFIKLKVNLTKILPEIQGSITEETTTDKSSNSKEPKWQKWLPFTLIYGAGKVQPVYVWITVFSSLGAWMIYIKNHAASLAIKNGTYTVDMISDTMIATVLAFVSSLILLYNSNRKYNKISNKLLPSQNIKKQNDENLQEGNDQP